MPDSRGLLRTRPDGPIQTGGQGVAGSNPVSPTHVSEVRGYAAAHVVPVGPRLTTVLTTVGRQSQPEGAFGSQDGGVLGVLQGMCVDVSRDLDGRVPPGRRRRAGGTRPRRAASMRPSGAGCAVTRGRRPQWHFHVPAGDVARLERCADLGAEHRAAIHGSRSGREPSRRLSYAVMPELVDNRGGEGHAPA